MAKNNTYILQQNKYIDFFVKNKTYYLHCSYHLGDNGYNFLFFYSIKEYIESNGIKIFYYTLKEYLPQLKEFLCSPNVFLSSLEFKPKCSIELWGDEPLFKYSKDDENNPYSMNDFLLFFYNRVLRILKLNYTINKIYYIDEDLINRYNKIPDKYKDFDILIVNSQPRSGQFDYDKNDWDNYIHSLNKHFKILTTTKVGNVLCTMDDNLTIKDIASLSTKAKIVIAVNSGVVPGLLNYYTLTNVKHFFAFDKYKFFTYPNFENKKKITDITFEELNKYLS